MRRLLFIAMVCSGALLMQSLGLLHGYAHPHRALVHGVAQTMARVGAAHADVGADVPLAQRARDTPAAGWLHGLFGQHDAGSTACKVFDQLTHADVLHASSTVPLTFAAPIHPDAVHAAWHHATQVTGFLARGPPAIG